MTQKLTSFYLRIKGFGGVRVSERVINLLSEKEGIFGQDMLFPEKAAVIENLLRETVQIPVAMLMKGNSYARKWPDTIYLYHRDTNIAFPLVTRGKYIPTAFQPRFK